MLWPDAEGDTAHSSFTTTLSRLRKLIGEDALYLRDGCLTLDARRCWVDVWAFQRILGEAQNATSEAQAEELTRKALSLYHGPFLNAEDDTPWLHAPREQLRKRLTQTVVVCAEHLKKTGLKNQAIALCQIVLAVDPATQKFLETVIGS